jgi:integral membrane sensor domain MASE1
VMYYFARRNLAPIRGRWLEAGVTLAATFAIAILVFTARESGPWSLTYLLFPVVMWAAVRFTQIGVVTTTILVAAVAIWATMSGLGPFVGDGLVTHDLLRAEQYLCVLSATALVLAITIKQRLTAEQHLRSQRAKLEQMDLELKEANRRVTRILAEILEGSAGGKRTNETEQYERKQL